MIDVLNRCRFMSSISHFLPCTEVSAIATGLLLYTKSQFSISQNVLLHYLQTTLPPAYHNMLSILFQRSIACAACISTYQNSELAEFVFKDYDILTFWIASWIWLNTSKCNKLWKTVQVVCPTQPIPCLLMCTGECWMQCIKRYGFDPRSPNSPSPACIRRANVSNVACKNVRKAIVGWNNGLTFQCQSMI